MTPAPLSVVIDVVANATGYNPASNRRQIVDLVNGVMGMLYRTPALRMNYCNIEQCALAQAFVEKCNNPQPFGFIGVVMPPGVSNIREVRSSNVMFDITDKRVPLGCYSTIRGYNRLIWSNVTCQPKAEHLTPRLLERDIPCGSRVVTFQSKDDEDCGKAVGVRYIDLNGNEQREDVVLGPSPSGTSVSVLEFIEISFPKRRGEITVETADGDWLGSYHPSIYTPVHEWFRLQAGCCGMKVSYRGVREPIAVVFDTDMLPFSDPTLWRLALKAYEHLDSMELDGAQNAALARIYSQLAAVTTEDLAAKTLNFNARLLPETGREMLATGRLFSRA